MLELSKQLSQIANDSKKPDFRFESLAANKGFERVCGVDEAGVGPLAGPVVAVACVLNPERIPKGLNDSKKLSAGRRAELFVEISEVADVGVGIVSAQDIDRINILQATYRAMTLAVENLPGGADFVLVDGNRLPPALVGRSHAIVKGDARSLSIAAASIVAKVTRDRIMELADQMWPAYGFARHAGYGTKMHLEAIASTGACPIHRMTFAPLKSAA